MFRWSKRKVRGRWKDHSFIICSFRCVPFSRSSLGCAGTGEELYCQVRLHEHLTEQPSWDARVQDKVSPQEMAIESLLPLANEAELGAERHWSWMRLSRGEPSSRFGLLPSSRLKYQSIDSICCVVLFWKDLCLIWNWCLYTRQNSSLRHTSGKSQYTAVSWLDDIWAPTMRHLFYKRPYFIT